MLVLPAMITDYWSLLNISSKQIQWVLGKALPDITLSKQSITLDSNNLTDTFTITTNSTGNLSAISSDDSIVTASLFGNTVTVEGLENGNVTITISVTEYDNYLSNSKTLSVTCSLTQPLVDCTPEQIQSIVNEGKAAANWSVGDTTVTITMSGNVSDGLTLNNYQCKAILIGIDHNIAKETDSKSSAHFILGKDASNNEIAFCDFSAYYGNNGSYKTSGTWFNHYNSESNYGGWEKSNLHTNILPRFKSALPSAWQNILGTVTKYSDNKGGGNSNAASYVTGTSDQLFLLAEWEVFGKRTYANTAEQNNQQQYTYFKNGNGKVRVNHQSTGTAVCWWLRSVYATYSLSFAELLPDGSFGHGSAYIREGVVPGFAIIQS